MRSKKIYAFFASLGLVCGLVFPLSKNILAVETSGTSVFTDVPSDSWYHGYVDYLYERGIVKGLTDTEFVPMGNVTIAETAALITRYLGLEQAAAERKSTMELLGITGSDKWYAGYIQLMHEAGIMDVTLYGCTVEGTSVSIYSPELLAAPVKRYEFATFIARSFELQYTGITTGNGTYGNEFIRGGSYDESLFADIIPFINDYYDIPTEYSYYVLKNYYNGIFNGDDLGNFNPNKYLTRAEMAKVITVVTDMNQRAPLDRYIPESAGYILSDDSYTEYKGVKYLKNSVSDSILEGEVMNCITVDYLNGGITLNYKPSNYYPIGLSVKMRLYKSTDSAFYRECDVAITDGICSATLEKGDICLFVLYNAESGEAVDAYEISLNHFGLTENSYCNYLP